MRMNNRVIKADDVESVILSIIPETELDADARERLTMIGEVYHGLPYHVESIKELTKAIIQDIKG